MFLKAKRFLILIFLFLIGLLPNSVSGQTTAHKLYFPHVGKYDPPWIIPNDGFFQNQWGLNKIKAIYAWYLSKGDGITIGIVDTGVDLNHPDLFEKIVPGFDYVNNDSQPQDDHGHGTHVAGIAAAKTNNFSGIAGLGWNARIMPVKVLNFEGSGFSSWIANGIIGAASGGAKIINLSLGSSSSSTTILNAVNYANSLGALVVAAAGNCGDPSGYLANGCNVHNPTIYPAAYPNVLAVGATDANDNRAGYSSYGYFVDVTAPGSTILSSIWNDNYSYKSGTSMAAPLVAGLAALVWSRNPALNFLQVGNIIAGTADDLGAAGRDDFYGYGRVNAQKAVTGALGTESYPLGIKLDQGKGAVDPNGRFEAGSVLVGFKKTVGLATRMEVFARLNLDIKEHIPPLDVVKVKVAAGTEIENIRKLLQDPLIEFAEPDYVYYAQ